MARTTIFHPGKKYHEKNPSGKMFDICARCIKLTISKGKAGNPEKVASRALKQM